MYCIYIQENRCSILLQVEQTNETFQTMKDKLPQNKLEPPVAGAITWTRFLFRHLKNTIISFLKVPEMRESEHIKTVSHFTAKLILL